MVFPALHAREMKPGEVRSFRYLCHGCAVPERWALADTLETTHHGWFAVLIIQAEPALADAKND